MKSKLIVALCSLSLTPLLSMEPTEQDQRYLCTGINSSGPMMAYQPIPDAERNTALFEFVHGIFNLTDATFENVVIKTIDHIGKRNAVIDQLDVVVAVYLKLFEFDILHDKNEQIICSRHDKVKAFFIQSIDQYRKHHKTVRIKKKIEQIPEIDENVIDYLLINHQKTWAAVAILSDLCGNAEMNNRAEIALGSSCDCEYMCPHCCCFPRR